MKRTSKLLRTFLVCTTILLVVSIFFLETGSRYYECPYMGQNCSDILVCDPNYYPVRQEKIQMIQALIESKGQGTEPSREDLDKIINQVKYEDMMGLNGILCGSGMVFVRGNLRDEGKYFVARHELEHLFIRKGVNTECLDEEQCAMLNAARIYPIGFIETVLSSIYLSAKESPTVWCFLFGSWTIFREDILAWH